MNLKTKLFGKVYAFNSIKEVLAKASELKSGDVLAGISAENTLERIAAKEIISELTVRDIRENPVVPYEKDSVTRLIQDDLDEEVYAEIANKSLSELREWLLNNETTGDMMLRAGKGMTSEVIAAVSKIMGNLDLIYAGSKIKVLSTCNTTIGEHNVLASRLQPNHPVDDTAGVAATTFEGLSYGIGDAVIGLNPSIDTFESTLAVWNVLGGIRDKYEIPTQICVLSHVTTQMAVLQSGKGKADLCFQSLAGSQKACDAFGITVDMLDEANRLFRDRGSGKGKNVMYFETGQGSELSSDAHYGSDQQTMESRCYGLARHYEPFLVNTVVGFMGPEYVYDTKQLLRAGLEDVFCGHLHGLPMGCDVCYTNHMPVDQNDSETLLMLLANAGCHYVMGLPQADDIMLMYQSTGFHDVAAVREILRKEPIKEFKEWMEKWGIWENGKLTKAAGDPTMFFK
ncbi:MAG: ethanolamine ammonia-lyase subunit EutB [Oscillospiraceae bacterium]